VDGSSAIVLKATSFEIGSPAKSDASQKPISGFIGIEDSDEEIIQKLRDLCSRGDVEKLIIVYNNYEFQLVGVSLSENTSLEKSPRVLIGRNIYRFTANDVGLTTLHNE